jgi:hypothetical protein
MSHRNSRIFQGPRYREMPRLYDVHVLFWSIRQHSQALGLPAGMNFAARPSSTKLLVGAVVSPRMNLPFGSIWDSLFHHIPPIHGEIYWFTIGFTCGSNILQTSWGLALALVSVSVFGGGYSPRVPPKKWWAHEQWIHWDSAPSQPE